MMTRSGSMAMMDSVSSWLMPVVITGSSLTQSGYSTELAGLVTAMGFTSQRTMICRAALDRQTIFSGT